MPPLLKSRKSKQVTLETAAVWGYRVEIADEHQEELRTLQGVCQLLGLLQRLTPLIQVISSHIKKRVFKNFLQGLNLEVKKFFVCLGFFVTESFFWYKIIILDTMEICFLPLRQ